MAYHKLRIRGFADLIVIGWKKSRGNPNANCNTNPNRNPNPNHISNPNPSWPALTLTVTLRDFFQPITIRSANPRIRSFRYADINDRKRKIKKTSCSAFARVVAWFGHFAWMKKFIFFFARKEACSCLRNMTMAEVTWNRDNVKFYLHLAKPGTLFRHRW